MTEVTEPKITPPMNHSIEKHKLKVGDHIYRRLDSIGGVFGDHHGIVIEVNGNDIKVIEMTDKGIGINSLSGFLNNHTCRKVYYNTTKFYQTIQRPGTCHTEKASPINRVLKRIKKVKKLMKGGKLENPKTYCLFGANCEEFATWIKTGLYKGTKMSQLKGGKRICESIWNPSKEAVNVAATNGITCALKKVAMVAVTSVDDLASTALSSTKSAVNSVGKTAATEIVENSAKIAARGIGAGVGIAVGLEIIISIGRVVKYKKDYKYTKCDLWRDLGRSWITTIVCAAIGVSSLAIGWWAILPAAGAGLLLTLLFRYFNVFDRKSHKEKVYKEYKLNKDSSVNKLKRVRRKIRRQIRIERLHPDQWRDGEFETKWWEKYKVLSKLMKTEKGSNKNISNMWLTALMEMLKADITCGYVLFDSERPRQLQSIEYQR